MWRGAVLAASSSYPQQAAMPAAACEPRCGYCLRTCKAWVCAGRAWAWEAVRSGSGRTARGTVHLIGWDTVCRPHSGAAKSTSTATASCVRFAQPSRMTAATARSKM